MAPETDLSLPPPVPEPDVCGHDDRVSSSSVCRFFCVSRIRRVR
jgi:hypothetical protein